MKKERLDLVLFNKDMIDSRSLAQRIIMAGNVSVNGEIIFKPSHKISIDSVITIHHGPNFVSRGGEKLDEALKKFGLTELFSKVCVDVGSSTGGFTDCLLQNGAKKVYAIDVGYGILHWKLRNDERVVVMERTNARYVENLPEKIDFVTIDASFISLKVLLPVIWNWLELNAQVVALIKPQFEAGRKDAAKGAGVIRNNEIHEKILREILEFSLSNGFDIKGLIKSPLTGPKGNIEFLVHLQKSADPELLPAKFDEMVSEIFTSNTINPDNPDTPDTF
jgi:23S rRNA (cytidine1920-2'-O)/16S rRNA (cytidine1409-2'-O)-methyltransferase